jgi:hypothetical protein
VSSAGLLIGQVARSTSSVSAASVSITITKAVPAAPTAGAPVSIDATLSGAAGPGATVTFFDGGAQIGRPRPATRGTVSVSTAFPAGTHTITANYHDAQGGSAASAPFTLAVGQVGTATATISFTATPNPVVGGSPVTLTAAMSGPQGMPTGMITFKNGPAMVSNRMVAANGIATVTVTTLPVGNDSLTAAYGGDGTYAPVTATPIIEKVNPSANDKFVQHVYLDLIGVPDVSGQTFWSAQLARGLARYWVAYPATQTDRYRGVVVTALYQQVMQRPVDGPGLAYWVGRMAQGLTPEQLAASLVGSQEMFNNPQFGNGQVDTYVAAVYQSMLGRVADPPGFAFWRDFMNNGGPAWKLTLDFAYSPEWAAQTVNREFAQFHLGAPDGPGLSYWQGRILGGLQDDQLGANLVASQAYFDWAQAN